MAFSQREWFAEIYDEHLLRLPFDIRMSVFHQSTTIFMINCRKLITRQTGAASTLWLGFHSLWSCMPFIRDGKIQRRTKSTPFKMLESIFCKRSNVLVWKHLKDTYTVISFQFIHSALSIVQIKQKINAV